MQDPLQSALESFQQLGLPEEEWPYLLEQLAEANCAFYASQYLRGPPEAPYSGRFLVGEHHEEWSDLVGQHDRLCVLAPRDHGKTFFFDMAYPIWQAERHPGREGYIFSGSQPQAERILGDIADEIRTNPKLRHLCPKSFGRDWSNSRIKLANGHTIFARGYGTKVRGAHPVWIVVDDGLNDEDAYSDVVRRKNIDYFYNAITNMCVPGGQIIVVGTPFHQQDLYADLSKNKQYHFQRYQAWDDKTQKALWPERYSAERLAVRRQEVGEIRFAREFMCNPISDDASLFPLPLFKGEVEAHHAVLGLGWDHWMKLGMKSTYIGVDFAMSTNVGADFTVLWVMGIDKFGNRWILDIIRERGMSFQEQLSLIQSAAQKYNPGFIYLESNQMQRIFGEELIRTTDLPIKQCHTGESKHSLEKGIPSLRVILENQKIRIPRGDDYSRELTDIWIEEMRNHTFNNGKVVSVGAHDDTAMAFYICEQAIRAASFGFSFGEEEEDEEAYQEVMAGMPLPGVKRDPDAGPGEEYDSFYDDEVDEDFVLGATPQRGRPRRINAQLTDAYGIEEGDKPPRQRGRKGEPHAKRRPRQKSYEEVRPDLGSPSAAAFLNGIFGGNS